MRRFAGVTISIAAIFPIAALAASCTLRDVDFLTNGGTGGPSDAGDAQGDVAADADAGPCPILTGGDVCTSIQKFTAKTQVLDGAGDEFCDIKATKFVVANGVETDPTPPPPGIATVAWIRPAYNAEGLHLHVHVVQANVFPPTATESIWRGDAIEVFTAGYDKLTGNYNGTTLDPGAVQIIAAPPGDSVPERADFYTVNGPYGSYANFGARRTPDGYDIELKFLWSDIHGSGMAGTGIGFDLAVDVREFADATRRPLLQSFLYFKTDPATQPGGCDVTVRGPGGHPSCDDKTWCTPKLQ
jgi:hypothetical protein